MKATLISLEPTPLAKAAGRPSLTPELLAATIARCSRNNEGFESILAMVKDVIDRHGTERAVDAVFRFIDYGHASIGDICPVAIFLDKISIWLAYEIWSQCPTRIDLPIYGVNADPVEDEFLGGQESSTRYIQMSSEGLPSFETLGVPFGLSGHWEIVMRRLFEAYDDASKFWQQVAQKDPSVMRIPQSLLDDKSEKAQKQVLRMQRNYVFDRARYFLPVAALTSMAMVMPARTWAALCRYLDSYPLPEYKNIANLIRKELALASPNLIRHSTSTQQCAEAILSELQDYSGLVVTPMTKEVTPTPSLLVYADPQFGQDNKALDQVFAKDLRFHKNRYDPFGRSLRSTAVRFGWNAVALAEIRDLNRHRTGDKDAPPVPLGFYGASDQYKGFPTGLLDIGYGACASARGMLAKKEWCYPYFMPLGVQFRFSHVTLASKFIYEAELRTGTGSHYRYAKHLRDVLQLWYEMFPSTKGLILEGSAEPE